MPGLLLGDSGIEIFELGPLLLVSRLLCLALTRGRDEI